MPERLTPPPDPALSASLQTWLTDPEWPQNPRIWTPTMPANIRQTLTHLAQQTNTPLILIQVNLNTYTATTTKLWPPD